MILNFIIYLLIYILFYLKNLEPQEHGTYFGASSCSTAHFSAHLCNYEKKKHYSN